MSEIIIKVDLEGTGETLKSVIGDLETFKQLLIDIKANKNALASAETIANVQKLTAELKKAELQVAQLQKKSTENREKENRKLKEQSGIIGSLIAKKKELGKELFSAKTVDDVRKINGEIAKTNLEIVKLKNVGVSSFNTFEKALASFQFKFNFLGNLAANAVGTFKDLGIEGAKAFFNAAVAAGVFGESLQTASLNAKNLEASLKIAADAFDAIGKGVGQELATALGDRIEAIGLDILDAEQAVRDAQRIQIQGLQGEDLQKALDARKQADEKLLALRNELIVLENEVIKAGFEKKAQTAKKGTDEEIRIQIQAFEDLIQLQKQQLARRIPSADPEQQIASEKQFTLTVNRQKKLNELIFFLIEELNERKKKADEDAQKDKEKSDKEAAKAEQKRLQEESDENFKLFSDGLKRKQDLQDKANKGINDSILDQRKLFDAQQKLEEDEQKAEDEAFEKNKKQAQDDVKESKKLAEEKAKAEIEAAEKVSDAFFKQLELRNERQQKANEQAISELDRQIDFQQELALKGEKNTLGELEKERAKALEQKAALEEKEHRRKEAQQLVELFLEFMKVFAGKDGGFGAAAKATALTLTAKALASAFAAEGGMMEDLIQPMAGGRNEKGLFKGRSHSQGGILTLLETQGGEGILTDKEVNNLGGAKGFYMLKDLLRNPVKDDFLEQQEQSFAKMVPVIYRDDKKEYRELTGKIDELIDTVRNKTEWTISENLFGELVKVRREKGNVKTTIVKNTPIINGR